MALNNREMGKKGFKIKKDDDTKAVVLLILYVLENVFTQKYIFRVWTVIVLINQSDFFELFLFATCYITTKVEFVLT